LSKQPTKKLLVLCLFVHETCWFFHGNRRFFKVFERTGSGFEFKEHHPTVVNNKIKEPHHYPRLSNTHPVPFTLAALA
jgi:hypothetical protein